jgi:hypothetical protein
MSTARLGTGVPPRERFSGYRYVARTGCRQVNFVTEKRAHEQAFETPFWMCWHRDTGRDAGVLEAVEGALRQAGEAPIRDQGHVWVSLRPPLGVGGKRSSVSCSLGRSSCTRPPARKSTADPADTVRRRHCATQRASHWGGRTPRDVAQGQGEPT